ncbi:DUF551 domain-containing protein [Serratia quinivorans]|uniref:DUF551 domain-containing protein n=1 Tax=Serratia quinivorans TaxID=137545 RepID=UPI003F6F9CAD
MTKTLTTTEELKHLASSDNTNELTRRLARECLASREAQPVAWTSQRALETKCKITAFTDDMSALEYSVTHGWKDIVELYTAPPSPAVPPEKQYPDVNEFGGDPYYEPYITECDQVDGWNACRAAMLAQPVSQGCKLNSPETPDGWVACKDRMPEDEQALLVQTHSGFRYVSFYDEHTGLFYDTPGGNLMNSIEHILVTHWMPLPAAPEGGNG